MVWLLVPRGSLASRTWTTTSLLSITYNRENFFLNYNDSLYAEYKLRSEAISFCKLYFSPSAIHRFYSSLLAFIFSWLTSGLFTFYFNLIFIFVHFYFTPPLFYTFPFIFFPHPKIVSADIFTPPQHGTQYNPEMSLLFKENIIFYAEVTYLINCHEGQWPCTARSRFSCSVPPRRSILVARPSCPAGPLLGPGPIYDRYSSFLFSRREVTGGRK